MPYFKVTKAKHAMCCAHLLRELTGIFENHPEQEWAREMYDELLSMYRAANFVTIQSLKNSIMLKVKKMNKKNCEFTSIHKNQNVVY